MVLGPSLLINSIPNGKNLLSSYVCFILHAYAAELIIVEGHRTSQCKRGVLGHSECRQWRHHGHKSVCRSDFLLRIDGDKSWECYACFIARPSKSLRKSPEYGEGRGYLVRSAHFLLNKFQFKQAIFLGSMTHKTRGLEPLAILYSMPYALLMWSCVVKFVRFVVVLTCSMPGRFPSFWHSCSPVSSFPVRLHASQLAHS